MRNVGLLSDIYYPSQVHEVTLGLGSPLEIGYSYIDLELYALCLSKTKNAILAYNDK